MTAPAPERPTGIRKSMGGLALVGLVVTLVPAVLVYLGLRSLGLGIGPAGLVGLLLEFVGCFAYCGWLFAGGKNVSSAGGKNVSSAGGKNVSSAGGKRRTS